MVQKTLTLLITALLLLIPQSGWSRQCREYFETPSEAVQALISPNPRRIMDEIPWDSWFVRREQTRLSSPNAQHEIDVLNDSSFAIELSEGAHRASSQYISTQKNAAVSTEPVGPIARSGLKRFNATMSRAVKFVLENYQNRRAWPESFHEKLKQLAKSYLRESTYIMIEARSWHSKITELIGTIRLIREKNGKIPMEEYLGFKIKAGADILKIEPGNFAIKSEANELAWTEIAIQMIAHMKRYRHEFGREPYFATYADAFSERLYGGMGFKHLSPEDLVWDGGQTPAYAELTNDTVKIEKDGVVWTPMYATEAMLTEILKKHLSRPALKRNNPALYDRLSHAVETTSQVLIKPAEIFYGTGEDLLNGNKAGPAARLYVMTGDPTKTQLYLQSDYEHQRNTMRARQTITVPPSVHEGFTSTRWDGAKITYSNGVLKLTQILDRTSMEIEVYEIGIDAQLRHPRWTRVVTRIGNRVTQDSRFQF